MAVDKAGVRQKARKLLKEGTQEKSVKRQRRQVASVIPKPKRTKPVQKTGGGGQKLTPQQRQQAQAQRMARAKSRAAKPASRLQAQMASRQGPKLSRRASMASAERRAARLQAKRRG